MIAEIKKYTFLVHHSDYADLLNSLGEAGVVHIVEKRKLDENTEVAMELKSLKKYRDAIRQLTTLVQTPGPDGDETRPEEVLGMFESLQKELEESKQQIELLKTEAEKAKPWGSFNTDTIRKIEEYGWCVSLFECPEKSFDKQWQESNNIEIINRIRGRLYFAVIHKEGNLPDIRAEKVKIPVRPVNHILKKIEQHEEKIESLKSEIKRNSPVWISSLKKGTEDIINRFEYSEAVVQADKYAEDNLYVLEGWVPASEDRNVQELLMRSNCYSFISDPPPDEKIPVILRNNKFSELFEPISKLFALPAYRELDLTPFFAPFFMLFFGFCLGDAGYGLFFIIAGFIIKRKIDKKYRPVITLAQYFGVAAVIMGLLSGTFFGINLIDSGYTITEHSISEMKKANVPEKTLFMISQVKDVKFESRQSFTSEISGIIGADDFSQYKNIILKNAESDLPFFSSVRHFMLDSLNMFYLAILLGALQIIFGMILRIVNLIRMKGFKYSLSTIGWVILIISLVIFMGGGRMNLVDGEKFKLLFIVLLGISGILIFLFNNPGKNVFIRFGLGIWDSYNVVTGIFGDLLSYIRLFALGISSSILGFVFNEISLQMLSVRYVGWLFFVILLLVGHSLNIAIAALGSFVHPMRLTFVEFYKNAGFTGGGIEYKPFKIRK